MPLWDLGILYHRATEARREVWGSRVRWGWMLVGWGLFNLLEGLVDHEVLGVHHVHYGPYMLWWDIGFLISGLVLVAGGWMMQHGGARLRIGTAAPELRHA